MLSCPRDSLLASTSMTSAPCTVAHSCAGWVPPHCSRRRAASSGVASAPPPFSPPHPSHSASLPVTRRRTASCSGRRSHRDRSSGAAACHGRRWRSTGRWPPTNACARWCRRVRRRPIPNSATPCTSRWAGSSRDATISITSPSAVSAARWAAPGRCQPGRPGGTTALWRGRMPAL